MAPANLSNSSDSKSNHIGRFVVLKATVSNTNEDTPTSAGPDLSALDDTGLDNGNMATSGPPETHYWTVSGGKEVLLTAPGARRVYDSRPTSGGPNRPMHTRFRQFFVENLRSSRQRTHSEQQANCKGGRTPQPPSESPNKLKPPTVKFGGVGLPPHAHTITAGTGSAVARALLQSTQRAKDDGSIESSGNSGLSSSPMHYPSISLSSVNDSEGGGSYKGSKKRLKSTHTMVKKLLKISSNQKKQGEDYGDLPDPSKLPREMPQSSLEFTQSRLKNAPRRSHPSGNYGQKGSTGDVIPRVLPQVEAKSEELLLSAFSRSLSNSSHGSGSHSHHHRHHHHHHSDHHGHHSREVNPSTLTRVTENRRYLMFTKASPFRSPYDFMQTRGKGLHESEVYTVLFRHTTCYELMPESAKLVTLDSILPVGKAFRALCENAIRAAPVWDSETQTFSGVLTINDFLEMLTYCWRKLIGNNSSASSGNPNSFAIESNEKISIEELESMPIKKWKEIRSRLTNRRSSGMDQHDTIHEEDENVPESSSSDNESDCNSSSSSSRSNSSSSLTGEDRDVDSNSVASAPSQIGESNTPRPPKHPHPHTHHHHYHHHSKTTSVRGCDFLRAQGGKCLVRLKYHRTGGLTVIYPEDSLYSALRLLAHCKLHRLPVFDDPMSGSGNPLFILTHRSLLAYLYKKQIDLPRPKYLQAPLKEAGVGTYKNLSLVLPSTKLVDALAFFENETVSVLPVVDSFSNRRLLDIFAKFDVITLILAGKHKKPDMTVQDVLDICKQIHRGVIPIPEGQNKFDVEICQTTDTIQFALNKLMRTGYHRLILVDNHVNCRVEGVVSISDLLYYMVLRPSPRGPVASGHSLDKSSTEAKSTDGEGTNPDWLFYSEKDPNAMGRSPCVPLVKDIPEPFTPNNKEAKTTTSRPAKQGSNRLRMTSESSVTTGSTVSSRSSSSSSTTSNSSTYSSSSGSSGSTSSTTSTTSRSRSSSPKRTRTVVNPSNSKGPPKRASIVDNRKGGNGKPRTKTVSS
ncbi:unnamed protein product [Hymenolepis diminuta]|uniref:CBS domain-containing protein n=1 Tax=Hymenolepis diminuta TaxID=6216 RepID=A0A3P6ZK57_HYMDI|nr:unnamed protein product [Hymenolepis diminuta]